MAFTRLSGSNEFADRVDGMADDDDSVVSGLPPTEYANAYEVVQTLAPARPMHLLRPKMIYSRSSVFLEHFPGLTAYAVRANPDPKVLGEVFAAGIDWYACDTIEEVEAVSRLLPDARIVFTHPIKPEEAIEQAYKRHRVRTFVIDHPDELRKIRAHAGSNDATLLVRVLVPQGGLQGEGYRYGCDIEKAAWLANEVVEAGFKLGLHFNIGSQVLNPVLFDEAFLVLREVMYRARFMLDMVSIGGGFPAIYEGLWPKPQTDYFNVVKRGIARLHLPRTCRVICTPGRALVADSVAVLARIEQRRGQMLYINDGVMGSLSNITLPWCQPPVRLVRTGKGKPRNKFEKYLFSGPSCYANDTMPGPFYLPEDARPGDYVEIGQQGAYAGAIHSAFHSLAWPEMVTVGDDPPIPRREEELPDDYHSGEYESDPAAENDIDDEVEIEYDDDLGPDDDDDDR